MNLVNVFEKINLIKFFENDTIKAITIIFISFISYHILIKYVKRVLIKSKIDTNFHTFIISLCKTLTITIFTLITLSTIFKVNISTFLAAFSVVGLALSLSVKDSLSNVASGILMLVSKPFENGNFIEINSVRGTVVYVNLIHTKLTTVDNKIIFIPNNAISKSVITNYSQQKERMVEIIFKIKYDNDIEKAKSVLLDVCKKSKFNLKKIEPKVRLESLQTNGLNIMLTCWCKTDDYLECKFYLNEEVKKSFDKNNITFAFS